MLHVVGLSPAARVKIKSRAVKQETKSAPTDKQQQQQQQLQQRYVQIRPIGNGPPYPASSSLKPEAGPSVLEIMDDDDEDDILDSFDTAGYLYWTGIRPSPGCCKFAIHHTIQIRCSTYPSCYSTFS
jgi:hypothetical protein